MKNSINIIEPTLISESGHCHSFIESLVNEYSNAKLIIWADRKNQLEFNVHGNVEVIIKQYFFRKIRKIQSIFLYRKLLKLQEKILISTANRTDLRLLNLLSKTPIPEARVFLFFHWINLNAKKIQQLKTIAARQPNVVILAPTETIAKDFINAGFKYVKIIPYPITKIQNKMEEKPIFKSVSFAGAARQDKGFSKVVDLLEYAEKKKLTIPFSIQTSADHYGKYDSQTESDILRLKQSTYPTLNLHHQTLSKKEYLNFFAGTICLQLYNAKDFADRISGVTLDALSLGTPIITISGTWMARQVSRFNAGIVINSTSPAEVLLAIYKIKESYAQYCKNAGNAGQVLQKEHQALNLIKILGL